MDESIYTRVFPLISDTFLSLVNNCTCRTLLCTTVPIVPAHSLGPSPLKRPTFPSILMMCFAERVTKYKAKQIGKVLERILHKDEAPQKHTPQFRNMLSISSFQVAIIAYLPVTYLFAMLNTQVVAIGRTHTRAIVPCPGPERTCIG